MTRAHMPTVAPALILGAAGWAHWHEPARLAGLALAELAALAAWPLILLTVVFGVPAILAAAWPRRWRTWYRRRHVRPSIPARLRRVVLAADRYRCAHCHDPLDLQLDHVMPWACGGLTSLWNLAVLCGPCNRVKSNYWRYRSGLVVYRSYPGSDDEALAAQILRAERLHRLSPARWLRAAWSLG